MASATWKLLAFLMVSFVNVASASDESDTDTASWLQIKHLKTSQASTCSDHQQCFLPQKNCTNYQVKGGENISCGECATKQRYCNPLTRTCDCVPDSNAEPGTGPSANADKCYNKAESEYADLGPYECALQTCKKAKSSDTKQCMNCSNVPYCNENGKCECLQVMPCHSNQACVDCQHKNCKCLNGAGTGLKSCKSCSSGVKCGYWKKKKMQICMCGSGNNNGAAPCADEYDCTGQFSCQKAYGTEMKKCKDCDRKAYCRSNNRCGCKP